MNKKQIELLRKRNAQLASSLDEAQFKIEYEQKLNSGSTKRAKDLISELENIKSEWNKCLSEIEDYKIQYEELITELKYIKTVMNDALNKKNKHNRPFSIFRKK